MKRLLQIAISGSRNRRLLLLTALAMCFMTIASQLELFTLGVIARKGPDFFELFGPVQESAFREEAFRSSDAITHDEMERRWQELDARSTGIVTKQDTMEFLARHKRQDFLDNAMNRLNEIFPVRNNLAYLACMIVLVALFKAIMIFIQRYSTRLVAITVSRDLRQQYFEHIQSLPMSFFQAHNIGTLASRAVGDAATIAEAVNACLINYLQTPFLIATTMTLCFLTSWKLSLIIFFGFPCIIFPIIYLARGVKRVSKQVLQNQERLSSVLIDFLSGIQTVKVFAMEDFSLKKYREHNQKMAALEQKSARYDLSTRPVVHTIGMSFLATALVYGLYVLNMSVAEVLVYAGLLYMFYEPIKKFAEENSHIQRGISAAERMVEVVSQKPLIEDDAAATELTRFESEIEFRDVWFRYGEEWVLKGVSFKVERGQTVAIVGPTGSGKSTIVQLLPRLYDIQKGEICIDGKPIQTFTQRSLRDTIAFVPQKPFLFLDTVSANIAFGRPFTHQEVEGAARQAHAEEFIVRLPQGYETELAEAGKTLSGGQQQRLAIARALVKRAPILVMDEATSSLDAISEQHIKSAIRNLRGQVTQIIIAHRLTTIEDADKIIYLENGKKIQEGTKEELLRSCPAFRRMWLMHKKPEN